MTRVSDSTDTTKHAASPPSDATEPGHDRHWLRSFARPELWAAAGYDASHHDFAWQHRELARLMSNECPLPPDDVVIEAALSAMREANFYPNSAWERDLQYYW